MSNKTLSEQKIFQQPILSLYQNSKSLQNQQQQNIYEILQFSNKFMMLISGQRESEITSTVLYENLLIKITYWLFINNKMSIFPNSTQNPQKKMQGNPFPFTPFNIFSQPDQQKNPAPFPNGAVSQQGKLFSNYLFEPKKVQQKGLFDHSTGIGSVFSVNKPQNYPFFKPQHQNTTSQKPLFPFSQSKPQINLFQVQNQVTELLRFKKDNELQKQMMEQMIKRMKQVDSKNADLQAKNRQLSQKNVYLQNQLKRYQQFYQQQQAVSYGNKGSILPPLNNQHKILISKINLNQSPISFDQKDHNDLFPNTHQASIFNEDDIFPNAFTQKTFITQDNYAFQAYVAFNAFYSIKYIILQKIKNKNGYFELLEATSQNLMNQNEEKKKKNWYIFHQNSGRNVIPRQMIDNLAKLVVEQMKNGQNNPINTKLQFGKYLQINEKQAVIHHPDWTSTSPLELQLYNYLNYTMSNSETRVMIKEKIEKWIIQKNKEFKNPDNQQVMWFDDAIGSLHVHWQSTQWSN